MIVLDTNVLSELMRKEPAPQVAACLKSQPVGRLFTTSITVAEILYGIRRLPLGRRRADLEQSFRDLMTRGFRDRLLVFDEAAAEAYSTVMTTRRRIGRPVEVLDAMIAAIALSRNAEVATRNTTDFVECGLQVIDPWNSSGTAV